MFEIRIETPQHPAIQKDLIFNPKYYDVDSLIETIDAGILPYQDLNAIGRRIQQHIQACIRAAKAAASRSFTVMRR